MDSLDFFERNGFVKIKSFLSEKEAKNLYDQLKLSIKNCAKILNISEPSYLSVIDAWGNSSHVIKLLNENILEKKKAALENLLSKKLECIKLAIRGKSSFFPHQTAAHQDLPYSIKEPYEYTVWLSLNQATEESGALMFQPGSHRVMNSPIDFWHPDYVDRYLHDPQLKQRLQSVCTDPGDLLIFHANIMHASSIHTSPNDRYALISRWKSEDFSLKDILSMYDYKNYLYNSLTDVHAFDSTYDIFLYMLEEKFNKIAEINQNKEFQSMPNDNFEDIINKLFLAIKLDPNFQHKDKALNILEKFIILKKSEKLNCGRNAATFLYKTLWHDCILPLLEYFNIKYII
ncbi:MAG: phytanoyl-CoA dioxygenase family protein [Candidatus Paracaedimonas acanthamoebae]|uniref:Phytanoyl-CoA dioxygenase family protein n=1 Tax=Candidatus Paracaedimonas acanthamoebae TaxID=244581 RepID=A0A8J7PKV6_9PROT|nr:phytanoyl-CoA dioxygenase family protein [Candidatus Paracaedimonas acanthamoebae]